MFHEDRQILTKRNTLSILNVLQQNNEVSRADIARITGLTPATVSNITNRLLELNLIHIVGPGKSSGGRRPLIFEFSPEAFYLVGVKIDISKTIAIVMDPHGSIQIKRRLDVSAEKTGQSLLNRIIELIDGIIRDSKIPLVKIVGIGVSFPGPVDVEKGIGLRAFRIPELNDIPMRNILENHFKKPCAIENDSRAIALGEARFGAGKGYDNIFSINIGPGIGSGIILNGELFRGGNSTAGEFGHITVDPTGPECGCGNKGCLEVMACGVTIAASAMRIVASGRKTLIKDLVKGRIERITADVVVEAAGAGDEAAQALIREAATYVGIALADVVNLINPGVIIFGGDIQFGDVFIERVSSTLREKSFIFNLTQPVLCFSKLGEDASSIGVAALALENIINRETLTQ